MKKIMILLLSVVIIFGVYLISPFYNTSKQYKDLSYYVMSDNTIKVFKSNNKKNQVNIPEKIRGKVVSAIAEKSIGFDENGNLIKDFVINGYTGSTAEKYSKNNKILFNCIHKFKDTTSKKATYSIEGELLRKCVCGYSYTQKISRPSVPAAKLKIIKDNGIGVYLEWSKIAGITDYYIYRSFDKGEYQKIDSVSGDNYYTDSNAKSGSKISYYILGYASDNIAKQKSNILSVDYLKSPIFRLESEKTGVKINWSKCQNVNGYIIYRKTSNTDYQKVATINDPSVVSYIDKNVTKKVSYNYTMRSFTSNGKQSGYLEKGKTIKFGKQSKVVYLTFDDGPSENTLQILKILKKYNAKGTFFVTANGKTEYMKNIVDAGSAIGLHTYSHNYGKIYSSTSNYFEDLNKIHNLVQKKTGVSSKVIRFPGGASNTISASYSKGIMTKLTKMVEDNGYSYFDWNVSSGDAEGDGIAASRLISNVRRDTGSQKSVVVLMHDTAIKKTTVQALPKICEYYISKGYEFDVLTSDSPICHQHVNN